MYKCGWVISYSMSNFPAMRTVDNDRSFHQMQALGNTCYVMKLFLTYSSEK